jgi:hypothetical protein
MAKFSEEEQLQWKERVRFYEASNHVGSLASWCRSQKIGCDSFRYWRKKFGSLQLPSNINRHSFAELSDSPEKTGITLEYHSIQIHLTHNFDPLTLTKCLQTLKGVIC